MESRVSKAVELKSCYNCAQAVACSYCDLVGVSEEFMAAANSAFGSGMGSMDGTCGAVVGAGVVLGLKVQDKAQARMAMKRVIEAFKARNGATSCRQLKGVDTGVVLRSCNDCVADAAEFLERELDRLI